MKLFALLTILAVALIMLIVNLGYANTAFPFLRWIPGRDVTGHFVIFAILSFAVVSRAAQSSLASSYSVRSWTTAILVALVTLDEFSQIYIPLRTFSLLDLSASLAGVLVGVLASIWIFPPRASGDVPWVQSRSPAKKE